MEAPKNLNDREPIRAVNVYYSNHRVQNVWNDKLGVFNKHFYTIISHHQPMITLRPTQQPERLEQPGLPPETPPIAPRVL